MPLDLTGVRAKLARAQVHGQAINHEIKTWHDCRPYSVIKTANAERTRYSCIARINEAPPFERISVILGDFLNNLRAALDHLVYSIAAHESARNPPHFAKKLQFPITDGRCEFDEVIAKRNLLGDISSPVVAVIERVQPYNRPHEHLGRPLGLLAALNNADKHRLLSVVFGAAAGGKVGLVSPSGQPMPETDVFMNSEVKDGTEIFALASDTPFPPDVKFDEAIFDIIVSVREAEPSASSPSRQPIEMPYLLDVLHATVRGIVNEIDAVVK